MTEYLKASGLQDPLDALGFNLVGYGCTTCIGNSGPLPEAVSTAIEEGQLVAASVLSGNRNFEGRIQPHIKANYLASPPLVVAYALAGSMTIDITADPLGIGGDGQTGVPEGHLALEMPRSARPLTGICRPTCSARATATCSRVRNRGGRSPMPTAVPMGGKRPLPTSSSRRSLAAWVGMPRPVGDITGARVLAILGDSVTTDHISPAGDIRKAGPAGEYLVEHAVKPMDFNSYGARRGNHEVMMRGTFANIRLRNELAPGTEGGVTRYMPSGETMPIYAAAMMYATENTPLVVFAGKEYGTGSSRDWAAKGTRLLGVKAVVAESFERIHRSNLVGMGVLPLQFQAGMDPQGAEAGRHRNLRRYRNRRRHPPAHGRDPGDPPRRRHRGTRTADLPHRYAGRGRVLPQRRHPAIRAAQHDARGLKHFQ